MVFSFQVSVAHRGLCNPHWLPFPLLFSLQVHLLSLHPQLRKDKKEQEQFKELMNKAQAISEYEPNKLRINYALFLQLLLLRKSPE